MELLTIFHVEVNDMTKIERWEKMEWNKRQQMKYKAQKERKNIIKGIAIFLFFAILYWYSL